MYYSKKNHLNTNVKNEKAYTLSEDSKFAHAAMPVWSAYLLITVLHTIFYLHILKDQGIFQQRSNG